MTMACLEEDRVEKRKRRKQRRWYNEHTIFILQSSTDFSATAAAIFLYATSLKFFFK